METILLIILLATGILTVGAMALLMASANPQPTPAKEELPPPVTIIIAAHNEAKHLALLLHDLTAQHYTGKWEIILALDRCTDASLTIAKLYPGVRILEIHEVPAGISPKKHALTQAIIAAKSDWLLFTDADCRMGPKWLMKMAQAMQNDEAIVLGLAPYRKEKGLLNLWVRFETWWTAQQYFGLAGLGLPYMGVGRNLAYRKSLWVAQKGFASHASRPSGDDDLFVNQAATADNTVRVHAPQAYTYSAPPMTWKAWWRQKTRHFSAGPAYRGASRIILPLLNGLQPLFFLSLLIVPATTGQWEIALAIAGARWAMAAALMAILRPPLYEKNFLWAYPLMDSMLAIHYLVVAPAGWILKPQWKAD